MQVFLPGLYPVLSKAEPHSLGFAPSLLCICRLRPHQRCLHRLLRPDPSLRPAPLRFLLASFQPQIPLRSTRCLLLQPADRLTKPRVLRAPLRLEFLHLAPPAHGLLGHLRLSTRQRRGQRRLLGPGLLRQGQLRALQPLFDSKNPEKPPGNTDGHPLALAQPIYQDLGLAARAQSAQLPHACIASTGALGFLYVPLPALRALQVVSLGLT
mmetsp:Transcript_34567/g.75699  ORF Transcript_34567/g.75699 Transcript_34567/m.75699 type:complete len:211 (+) Transcript_34567:1295-1927(+)